MSFPKYLSYKNSGAPWLGTVPVHWEVMPLKRLFSTVGERADGRSFPVALENIESGSGRLIESDGQFEGEGVAFRTGDILYGKLRPYLAKTWVASCAGEAVGDFHVLRAVREVEPNFYRNLLLSPPVVSVLNGSTFGAKMPRVSWDFMGMMAAVRPPIEEQRCIVAFLDREAAKIDALISEQERLIALLKEKRQAVISQAVIEGLNRSAVRRASTIPWLADIPSHWQELPLRSLAERGRDTFIDGDWIEAPYVTDEGIRLVQTGNIGVGKYKEQGFRFISEKTFDELKCTEVIPGDILICRLAEPVGRACVAPELGCRMITSVDVCILKPRQDVGRNYLVYLLSSAHYLGFMEAQCRGGTRDRVSRSFLGSVRVPLPPLDEQVAISRFLDQELAQIDALSAEADRAIALLAERRAALISAAVTGKIDVRGLALLDDAA